MSLKKFLRKIWKQEGVSGFFISLLFAFIVVKFVIYPAFGLLLGTKHPFVAVVSASMEHTGFVCGECIKDKKFYWNVCALSYEKLNISKQQFERFPFSDGITEGSVLILKGKNPADIYIGDIVVFKKENRPAIVHRIVKKWQENGSYFFQTKGDRNAASLEIEKHIAANEIVGVVALYIPLLGWPKIFLNWVIEKFKCFFTGVCIIVKEKKC